MADIIQPVKGTRDFYPEDKATITWLHEKMRLASERFGYQEFDGPFLEYIDLYAAKSGEELVKEQSFVFPDKSDNLLALRPELTPTLVRMIAQRQQHLYYPLRWWSFGPFWRYESPQKGRGREFFQWNVDLIGSDTAGADAEVVAVMASFFQELGLNPQQVRILVNNRRLMDRELAALDIPPQDRNDIFHLIDKRDKMEAEEWAAYAADMGLSSDQFQGLQDVIQNDDLWRASAELVDFFQAIEAFGASDYVEFAPYIIRGLDYYTGTVFEAQAVTADVRRALAGGGRYDNLLADVGGDPLPGVGFALGDMVLIVVLEELGLLPENRKATPAPVIVTVFDEDTLQESYQLAAELRRAGLKVNCYPEVEQLGKQFRHANRIGSRVATVLGPEELAEGKVAVKDLRARDQVQVERDEAAAHIRSLLEKDPAP